MYVRRLGLCDFRSWAHVDLELGTGATVLVAPNGYGKTNLVEALWYSATLGSYRVAGDAPLVRVGATRALVSTIVVNDGRELALDVEITAGRANKLRLNRTAVRNAREVIGVLRAVLFAPEDLAMVRGDPGERRRYLDDLASVRRPRIAGIRVDYDRVLRQRTALLKNASGVLRRGGHGERADCADRDVGSSIDVWDEQLATHGAELMAARIDLVNQLAPEVEKAYQLLAPERRKAAIAYRPNLEMAPEELTGDVVHLKEALLTALSRRRSAELERGVCLVGPHRDELELRLGDRPVKGFASHGESWSVALALRLAAYELLRDEGPEPVLLLDDVFAELDGARRRALAKVAGSAEQSLVTTAVPEDIPAEWGATQVLITLAAADEGRVSKVAEIISAPVDRERK